MNEIVLAILADTNYKLVSKFQEWKVRFELCVDIPQPIPKTLPLDTTCDVMVSVMVL